MTELEERKRGATAEKLEQNNMHYSLFFIFLEREQNKHAALASGAAARLLIERFFTVEYCTTVSNDKSALVRRICPGNED